MLDQPSHGRGWLAASDERLAALAGRADREAFEQLWKRHHRGLLAFCRQMLGRREDAEDAVQQTFLSAYRALGRGAAPLRFRPWLYAAARNQCLELRKARAGEMLADVVVVETEALPALVERRQEIRELLVDMQQLPEEQRAALALSTLRPLKHDEIAHVLGCSRNEVKALVFRARASLADSRRGRETPCTEIREELARSPRTALRRTVVRRHLRHCDACGAFRAELRRQRDVGALILLLPPTADLKDRAMELVFGAAAAGAVAGGGIGAAALGQKAGAVLAAAALGAAGGVAVHFGGDGRVRVPAIGFDRTASATTEQARHAARGARRPGAPGARGESRSKAATGASRGRGDERGRRRRARTPRPARSAGAQHDRGEPFGTQPAPATSPPGGGLPQPPTPPLPDTPAAPGGGPAPAPPALSPPVAADPSVPAPPSGTAGVNPPPLPPGAPPLPKRPREILSAHS
jgi:RNA polymerase sigma factor (sigma-70 family)